MAFHLGIRQSRVACYSVPGILEPSSFSFINKKSITNQAWNHKNGYGGSNKGSNQGTKWANTFKLGAVAGLTAVAFKCTFPKNDLLAESDDGSEEARIIDQESRQEMVGKEVVKVYQDLELLKTFNITAVNTNGTTKIIGSLYFQDQTIHEDWNNI